MWENPFVTPWIYSPPGSSAYGLSQARISAWVAISCSRGSSPPRGLTHASCLAGEFITPELPGKPCSSRSFEMESKLYRLALNVTWLKRTDEQARNPAELASPHLAWPITYPYLVTQVHFRGAGDSAAIPESCLQGAPGQTCSVLPRTTITVNQVACRQMPRFRTRLDHTSASGKGHGANI